MIHVVVHALTTDSNSKQQMVWLRAVDKDMMVPIVIGNTEAMSIYAELKGEQTPRPLTHDLLRTILDHFDAKVEEVKIVDLKDGIFFAELVLSQKGEKLRLDARPSDSIALALKFGAPVYVSDEVMTSAGYKLKPEDDEIKIEGMIRPEAAEDSPAEAPEVEMDVEDEVEDLLKEAGVSGPREPEEASGEQEDRIKALRKQMDRAVKEECYEEASRLRDEIAKLGCRGHGGK